MPDYDPASFVAYGLFPLILFAGGLVYEAHTGASRVKMVGYGAATVISLALTIYVARLIF